MNGGPLDLVLVRHGESEGNLAQAWSKRGDDTAWYNDDFKTRHTSQYRLTSVGRAQSVAAGDFIKENISQSFDKYFTSEYTRALETAANLNLPNAHWQLELYLRERDNGVLSNLSHQQRKEQFSAELERRNRDSFYWAPPGGESIANTCLRVDGVLKKLAEEANGMRVIVVCHGNIMKAFRFRLERMRQSEYHEMLDDDAPENRIYNGQILWYSRRNPDTERISSRIKWVRSVNPWDVSLCRNTWVEIDKPLLTNQELMQDVVSVPQLIDIDSNGRKIVRGADGANEDPTIHTDATLTSSGRPVELGSSPSD